MPGPIDPKDTQPRRGKPSDDHREYIPATWASAGQGNGHPKLSGGVTVDRRTGEVAPRALNRPDSRYEQPQATIIANRIARGEAEYAGTVILIGSGDRYEVRAISGNNYDVSADRLHCDCPDWLRMEESGYGIVKCKHIYMVQMALDDPQLAHGVPYSCDKVAEMLGADTRTIQNLCQIGECPATKRHNVWVIDPLDGESFAAEYRLKIWPYPAG